MQNKLFVIENPDKTWHEKWKPGRNLCDIPHPYQCIIMGPPNSGKTTIIYNLIANAHPEFDFIIVVHCDPTYTKEYDILGLDNFEIMEEIPPIDELNGKEKTLMVLDDLEYKFMDNVQKRRLDRIFGNASTHKNLSVISTAQDPINIPPCIRRTANLIILFKMFDTPTIANVCRKSELTVKQFTYIFDNIIKKSNDSFWIDLSKKTPAPYRMNCYDIIDLSGINSKLSTPSKQKGKVIKSTLKNLFD